MGNVLIDVATVQPSMRLLRRLVSKRKKGDATRMIQHINETTCGQIFRIFHHSLDAVAPENDDSLHVADWVADGVENILRKTQWL